jgi:ZIP family zinc transporter/zinc and cadmium transporter
MYSTAYIANEFFKLMMDQLLIKSSFAVLSAIMGSLIVFFIKLDHKKLCSLISFSAGSLLAAAMVTVLPELTFSWEVYKIFLGLASGYFLFWIISKYYFHVCPACSASHFDEQTTKKFSEIVLLLFTALGFHSFLDGVAISANGGHSHGAGSSIILAIIVHKFPEGLALASLMIGANYKKNKTILYVFLIQLSTIIGTLFGAYFFAKYLNETWMIIIESNIAGGFVFLSLHAIIGELLKNHKRLVITYFLCGIILIFALMFLTN